jgi:ubiquinone/menaquinone biosynthesis C-methylase UbiE
MKYDRKKVEYEFNTLSKNSPIVSFDPESGDIISRVGKMAIDLLELNPNDILVDIGTGRGRWALYASNKCKKVIGLDISNRLLTDARRKARELRVENVKFFQGSFEKINEETNVKDMKPNKLIAVYSMHHLTDSLKREAIKNILKTIKKPARVVIADLMHFEDPQNYKDEWENVYYDDGDTDFPSDANYLKNMFNEFSFETKLIRIHPLVGILIGNIK